MLSVQKSILINKPAKEVFDFAIAEGNYSKINPDVSEVVEHGPRNTVGSSWTETRKFMGQELHTTTELTEFVPNKKWAGKVIQGPILYETTITYEPVDGGTKVTMKVEGETKGFFKLAEGVVAAQLEKVLADGNQRLKDLLEKG